MCCLVFQVLTGKQGRRLSIQQSQIVLRKCHLCSISQSHSRRCSDSLQILPKFDVDRSISRECGHFSSIVPQSCSVLMVAASEAPPQAVPHCLLLPRHGQCTLLTGPGACLTSETGGGGLAENS